MIFGAGRLSSGTPVERRQLTVLIAFITGERPSAEVRARQHRGVLPGAVGAEPRRPRGVAMIRAPRGESGSWGPAREVAFLEPEVTEHRSRYRNVLGLTAVRSRCEREPGRRSSRSRRTHPRAISGMT
jgi:hypothetical protein